MDDMSMTQISTLAQVDPVFREVVEKLFPAADPRELWDLSKSMPDQSALHVNKGNRRKEHALARTGLAATGVAAVGGGHALYMQGRKMAGAKPKYIGAHRTPGTLARIAEKSPRAAKVAAAAGGAAWLGLHGTEMVGDALGLRANYNSYKNTKPKKQKVAKGISDEDAKALFEPIIAARRAGSITTEMALELVDKIEKGIIFDLKATKTALKFPDGGTALKIANRAQRGEKLHEDTNKAIHAGRVGVGAAAATTVAAVGYKKGKAKARATAVQRPVMSKSDTSEYMFTGEISKFDEDKRQVFGWCSLTMVDGKPVVDLQNDYISTEEIEKAAYAYVKNSRKGGDMHSRIGNEPVHVSDMIESVIVTPEKLKQMGVPEEAISKVNTGWWIGYQVNDDALWTKVKNGERTGFSIHGRGARLEKMLDD